MLRLHDQPISEVSVLVADDETMRDLNRRFRGVDASTDVLSFAPPSVPGPRRFLGDIAISRPIAECQAALRGVRTSEEMAMLAIHGVLHLLGHEDASAAGRARMIELMNRAAEQAGVTPDAEWRSRHDEEGA